MTEKEKMLCGELYRAMDAELIADRDLAARRLREYNLSTGREEQARLLRELTGRMGEGAVVRPPFFFDYGYNISLGRNVFLNYDCVLLDVAEITIGDETQIGPKVQIYAADHPRDPEVRRSGLELGRPVRIGGNVWIGGGAILLPGVTVGDDAVIGAGSVVTRDVPAGGTVVGNPARAVRRGEAEGQASIRP